MVHIQYVHLCMLGLATSCPTLSSPLKLSFSCTLDECRYREICVTVLNTTSTGDDDTPLKSSSMLDQCGAASMCLIIVSSLRF